MDDVKKSNFVYLYKVSKQPSMEASAGYSTSEKVEGCGCSVEKNTGLVRPPCACRHNNTPGMHAYLS